MILVSEVYFLHLSGEITTYLISFVFLKQHTEAIVFKMSLDMHNTVRSPVFRAVDVAQDVRY